MFAAGGCDDLAQAGVVEQDAVAALGGAGAAEWASGNVVGAQERLSEGGAGVAGEFAAGVHADAFAQGEGAGEGDEGAQGARSSGEVAGVGGEKLGLVIGAGEDAFAVQASPGVQCQAGGVVQVGVLASAAQLQFEQGAVGGAGGEPGGAGAFEGVAEARDAGLDCGDGDVEAGVGFDVFALPSRHPQAERGIPYRS